MREFVRHIDHGVESIGRLTENSDEVDTDINPEIGGLNFSDFESGSGSDDDELERIRKRKLKELRKLSKPTNVDEQVGKVHWYVGQQFDGPSQIKELVRLHAVDTRRDLFFDKNDKQRIRVKCKGRTPCYGQQNVEKQVVEDSDKKKKKPIIVTCPWVLYISKSAHESWMVKTFTDIHTCLQQRELKWFSSTFLSKQIGETITSNPEIPAKALKDKLELDYELGLKRQTAYRAKKKALGIMKGDSIQQYGRLRDYILELRTTNPNTTVRVDVEPGTDPSANTRIFRRIYICLGALKAGYKAGMREILGLDGAHMKKPQPGHILTAVSVDANNGIYPLAYAVVETENAQSWSWFLECLGEDLDLQANSNFTFISDRQKVHYYNNCLCKFYHCLCKF